MYDEYRIETYQFSNTKEIEYLIKSYIVKYRIKRDELYSDIVFNDERR